MSKLGVSTVVCLFVAIVIGGTVVVDTSSSYDSPTPQVSNDQPTVQVKIRPDKDTIEKYPTTFGVTVFNPPRSSSHVVWLTVGVSPPDDSLEIEIADDKPWYTHEGKLSWAKDVDIAPGEWEVVGISTYPESKPGNYEINVTISYLNNGTYETKSNTSTVIVERASTTEQTSPSSESSPDCQPIKGWLECNWKWLIPLASLIVAILSFFGYERVRETVPTKKPTDEQE